MLIRVSMDMLYCIGVVGVVLQIQKYSCCLCGGWIQNAEIQKHSSCLCAILARFKGEWGWRETNFWDVCKTQHFSFCLDIHAKHSKYRNTEIQQLSLCPSSGPKCPPLKNGHLGPRSVGPQTIGPPDSWAP